MANLVLKNANGGKTSVTADRFLGAADALYDQEEISTDAQLDNFLSSGLKYGSFNNMDGNMNVNFEDGTIISIPYSNPLYGAQIAIGNSSDANASIRWRDASGWSNWNILLHNGNYSSYALPVSGGTMTGDLNTIKDIIMYTGNSEENQIKYRIWRASADISGWAGEPLVIQDRSHNIIARYGIVGQKDKPQYLYIGCGDYSSDLNLRIALDGTVTAKSFKGSLTGNAATATKLQVPRTISFTGAITGSGSFDGSDNLSILTTAESLNATYLAVNNTEEKSLARFQFFQKNGDDVMMPDTGWWSLLRCQHPGYSAGYWQELALHFATDTIKFRRKTSSATFSWRTILHDGNFANYGLPKNGGTMTGNINMGTKTNGEKSIKYYSHRAGSASGWAFDLLDVYDNSDNIISQYGITGQVDTVSYLYIGCGNYLSDLNLRIAPNGIVTAKAFRTLNYGSTEPDSTTLGTGTTGAIYFKYI